MISVQDVAFSYKRGQKVIDDLSFEVPKGSVFGFLGANGSGKTTLIRLMTGLYKPQSGSVSIDGHSIYTERRRVLRQIGTMIEAPSFYGNLSGLDNLKIFCRYYSLPSSRAMEVLDLVGLSSAANRKARNYSLGMKQRLGIAMSILHRPDILILDEPLNGLDPKGIAAMRSLFLDLSTRHKCTIFISSHILSEIETTCTDICIIDKGRRVYSGSVLGLQGQLGGGHMYSVHCSDAQKALALLKSKTAVRTSLIDSGHFSMSIKSKEELSACMKMLLDKGVLLYEWKAEEANLESMYLKITQA